ncbi:unknown [Clostridium sp. CAG:609]|nr:unknown [Clostridium sp. CAG:609]
MYSLRKSVAAFALMLLLFVTTSAKAATLTDEEYSRLKIIFSDARIATMSDEDAQRYLSYDLENTNSISKYYRVTETANGTTSVEVTKTEAEEASQAINNNITRGASHRTTYKNIQIVASPISGNHYFMKFHVNWLLTPRVKSYDVNAMRVDDVTIQEGSQKGMQIYGSNNNYSEISYSYNGTNMVNQSNGFGISMNLVDAATEFQLDIEAIVVSTSKWATVYASYQHAATNVTLAQSKAYNISHNGYGEVINFATAVENYYDGMQGVSIALGYTG